MNIFSEISIWNYIKLSYYGNKFIALNYYKKSIDFVPRISPQIVMH